MKGTVAPSSSSATVRATGPTGSASSRAMTAATSMGGTGGIGFGAACVSETSDGAMGPIV